MIISAGKDRSLRLFSTIRDSQNTEFSQGKKRKEDSYVIDDLKLRQINQFDLGNLLVFIKIFIIIKFIYLFILFIIIIMLIINLCKYNKQI